MDSSKFWMILIALVVVLVVVIGLRRGAVAETQEVELGTRWEYKQLANPTPEEMNKAGEEGWELVHVNGGQPYVKSFGPAADKPNRTENTIEYAKTVYTFRRLVLKKP